MRKLRNTVIALSALLAVGLVSPQGAFASVVCPVIGGPNNPSIHATPADVPDKTGNPAHGEDPDDPRPGDAFWN